MSETSVITQASIDWLISEGEPLHFERNRNGNRLRLRRSALSSSESSDHSEITVPQIVESVDALTFCGLKKRVARDVLELYQNGSGDRGPYDLGDYIRSNIEGNFDIDAISTDSDADWDSTLKDLGIKRHRREALLDPEFREIRDTKSAKEWALELTNEAYSFLTSCDDMVQQKKLWNNVAASGQWANGRPTFPPSTSTSAPTTSPTRLTLQHAPPGSSRANRTSDSLPEIVPDAAVVRIEARLKCNETPFYKGGCLHVLSLAVNCDYVVTNKRLDLESITSQAGGDFNFKSTALYLTKEMEKAYKNAAFKRRHNPNIPVAILKINIPEDCMRHTILVEGDRWRELVYHSRRKQRTAITTELEMTHILTGLVCGDSNYVVRRMQHHVHIRPVIINGSFSTQHAFGGDLTLIEKRCVNKVTIIEINGTREEIMARGEVRR